MFPRDLDRFQRLVAPYVVENDQEMREVASRIQKEIQHFRHLLNEKNAWRLSSEINSGAPIWMKGPILLDGDEGACVDEAYDIEGDYA